MTGVERFCLGPEYTISRVIKGGWQLAGGHGTIQREEALEDMRRYVEAGIKGQGRELKDASLAEMDALWEEAKNKN